MSIKFYDTNGLLNLLDKAFEEEFVCSSKTLQEIEHLKVSDRKDQNVKYKARQLTRLLNKHEDMYTVVVQTHKERELLEELELEYSPDNIIMASAYLYNRNVEPIIFISNDVCCKLIAKNIFGLNVKSTENDSEVEYKGYKEVVLDESEMAYFYEHQSENIYNLLINEYLIIKNIDGEVVDKVKWVGDVHKPISFRQINNDFSGKVKPLNLQQELAFDLLQDNDIPIKVLSGIWGSGKDYLMSSTAIDLIKKKKFDKIMWVRNNIEVKNSKPIGFLPNGKEDKLLPFAMPLADHVGGKEGIEMLIQQGDIDIEHLGFIRGRDIKNTIVICSEAENMTKEHVQLLVSRVGEGSALWLNGDFGQVDSNVFESNNGLREVIAKLKGNKHFGYVQLLYTERSEAAKLASLLD